MTSLTKIKNTILREMAEIDMDATLYEAGTYGLRVIDEDYADGEILPSSRVWDDGDPAKNDDGSYVLLGGTSGVGITGLGDLAIQRALDRTEMYLGAHCYLIRSDCYATEHGWDDDEIIYRDALVVSKIW